jgi:DNA mismatch repair ATPase MutL
VRNEIETKRNETKRNETKSTKTKRNETKRNQQKRNETKRNEINKNETKRNEINEMKTKPTEAKRNQRNQNEIEIGRKNNRSLKEIKRIFTITMLDYFPHMYVFHQERTGFVTIEQEYYAFIQRESVLLTWWFLLNLGTIRATSSLLKGEELQLKNKQKCRVKVL